MTLEQAQDTIRPLLTPKRFHHSVCVSRQARFLALALGEEPERAALCGMLHDICKDMNPQDQLKMISDYGIILNQVERTNTALYHPVAGMVYLHDKLGIRDPELLNAVRYHTTGRAGMSLLEQVIYVADCISEDRDYPGVERLRSLAGENFPLCLFECCRASLQLLLKDKKTIETGSLELYNEQVLKIT